MKIYIYDNETKEQVDSYEGKDNDDCEAWANDKYGSNDYHWAYNDQPTSNAQ